MKLRLLAISAVAALGLGGCAGVASDLGYAFYQESQQPLLATEASVASKRGEACGENILGLIATGDHSIDAAKRNGGITQVTSVDADVFSIWTLYGKRCTIVRGN